MEQEQGKTREEAALMALWTMAVDRPCLIHPDCLRTPSCSPSDRYSVPHHVPNPGLILGWEMT